jgi:ribonucleoside-diphosphate reductase alpha chain
MSTTAAEKLSDLIFYDRYAGKDRSPDAYKPDRLCVVRLDPKKATRDLATIVYYNTRTCEVGVRFEDDDTIHYFKSDLVDVVSEIREDVYRRMARAASSIEDDPDYWEKEFFDMLNSGLVVPGGRMFASLGVQGNLTAYNCYVLAPPHDSIQGITDTLRDMLVIMSRGGGVGIPCATLRPRNEVARQSNGRSSGAVSWMEMYSLGTGLIEQGGSRRGALMMILPIWHPDIMEFITSKHDNSRLKNCNISVAITDEFMHAVEHGTMWNLEYPDINDLHFDTEWDGDLRKWKAAGYAVKVYDSVLASTLFESIAKSAWASAEPGIFFVDRYNQYSNSWYFNTIMCTNPCGEQGIPANAVCNLAHIALHKFVIAEDIDSAGNVDWNLLSTTVNRLVRFMDNVITIAYAPLEKCTAQQLGERRIGMGTLGLAEMLIRCHITYGDNKHCLKFLDDLYSFIAWTAYRAGIRLATIRGSFPEFNAEKYLQSQFMQTMTMKYPDVRDYIKCDGIRNVTYLTQAPTGTVGTMVRTSTGIEPYYEFEWERTSRLGTHKECASVYEEFRTLHPDSPLPAWFVTSSTLKPEAHVRVQAAIQKWVDSSISKTCNLPNEYTVDDVLKIYHLMWQTGCKGGTVYRDGSRTEQVLKKVEKEDKQESTIQMRPSMREVPRDVYDMKAHSIETPAGKLSVKVGYDMDSPFEAWLTVSKAGTAVQASVEGMARLISMILRMPSPMSETDRVRYIISQLSGISGGDPVGLGIDRVTSIPDGIAQGLEKILHSLRMMSTEASPDAADTVAPTKLIGDDCPQCHHSTLRRKEGCYTCSSCGYSKC